MVFGGLGGDAAELADNWRFPLGVPDEVEGQRLATDRDADSFEA